MNKFKVGDKVRRTRMSNFTVKLGDVVTVEKLQGSDGFYAEGHKGWQGEDFFELVETAPTRHVLISEGGVVVKSFPNYEEAVKFATTYAQTAKRGFTIGSVTPVAEVRYNAPIPPPSPVTIIKL